MMSLRDLRHRRTRELLDKVKQRSKSQNPIPSAAKSSGTGGENLCKLNGILHENFLFPLKNKE